MRTGLWIFSVAVIAAVAVGIPYAMLFSTADMGVVAVHSIALSSSIALCTTYIGTVHWHVGSVGSSTVFSRLRGAPRRHLVIPAHYPAFCYWR